jgi:hypothetical protein
MLATKHGFAAHRTIPGTRDYPALCRARARSSDVLLGLHPFLPDFRRRSLSLVPPVHRYYGAVRPLQTVHGRRAAFCLRGPVSVWWTRDGLEVSRFSCMSLLGVPRFSDYAGPSDHSRLTQSGVLPSPSEDRVGTRKGVFDAQSPRPPMPLSTLQASPRDAACKTQGQDGVARSFPAGLLHPLRHAGLSRRTLRPLITPLYRRTPVLPYCRTASCPSPPNVAK